MAITMNKCHVTMVLALNLILGLFGNFFTLWLVSSAVRSFTKIYKRNFHISWNFYEKGINYACTEDWILYSLASVFCCAKFHKKSIRGISTYLGISTK